MDSYEEIKNRMKERYESLAGAQITPQSDIAIRIETLAGELYKQAVNQEFILRQLFPTTATGVYLDRHAEARGITRKAGVKAHGNVIFYASSGNTEDIVIPRGTAVCTYTDLYRYETDEDVTLTAGSASVLVSVTAAQAGAKYNANGGTITVLVTPVPGVDRVYNGQIFTTGADEESDEELRERVLDSYRNINNSANAEYYKSLAMSVSGVYSAGVVPRGRGVGTVDVYVCANGGSVSSATLSRLQSLLDEKREINVDVRARHASEELINLQLTIKVKAGYSFTEVKALCETALEDYVSGLGIGKDVLISDLGEVVHHIEGVADHRFNEAFGSDRHISQSKYPSIDNLIIYEG